MSENNNLYVNATVVLDLIECMQEATSNRFIRCALEEVKNTILDLEWKEIRD